MVPGYPDRFIDLFARRREPAVVLNGAIYRLYNNMVTSFGPVARDYRLSEHDEAQALRLLGGILLRTTGGLQPEADDAWYAVVCRRFTHIDEYRSPNVRSKVRRALRNCEVRLIGPEHLAACGYEVYASAQERYGGAAEMDRDAFAGHVLAARDFGDIVQYWGVFCDGTLAGYSANYLFGTTEALYATLRFHPAYFRKYTSYALFHEMGRHYLHEQGFSYVNDGLRSILHDTELQEFLEHNFNFERASTPVRVRYRAPYGAVVRATFPLKRLLSRFDRRLGAVYELERSVRDASGELRR